MATAHPADMGIDTLPPWAAGIIPALGRLCIAPLFLLSGFAKLTGPAPFLAYIGSVGLPFPTVSLVMAILVELVGGTFLLVGYKTRITAAVIAVFTLMTALVFHTNLSDQTEFLFFFKNLAITGGLLQIVVLGGGRVSIDRR